MQALHNALEALCFKFEDMQTRVQCKQCQLMFDEIGHYVVGKGSSGTNLIVAIHRLREEYIFVVNIND